MKRIVACLTVLLLCVSLVVSAAAAEFTPSVTNKPAPEIVPGTDADGNPIIGTLYKDGEILDHVTEDCLIVTAVADAEKSTDIPEDAKETLLDVYDKLTSGEMTLPYEKYDPDMNTGNMVIRDLFDGSFLCGDHPEVLEEEGVTLEVTFDIGVEAGVEVVTMTYVDGEWKPIVKTVNNGDGTVTCTFEEVCPIAFSVSTEDAPPVQTGDDVGNQLPIWGLVALVSLAAIVVLTVIYRRDAMKKAQ